MIEIEYNHEECERHVLEHYRDDYETEVLKNGGDLDDLTYLDPDEYWIGDN